MDKLKTVLANLNNLESKGNKIDIYKLKPVAVELRKRSDVVDNDVVKNSV